MDKEKLKSLLALRGLTVNGLLTELARRGIYMGRNAYYRRLNLEQEFRRNEIENIVEILEMSRQDMLDIFFKD